MEQQRPKKLLDQVHHAIRLKHYSYRTEQAYAGGSSAASALPAPQGDRQNHVRMGS